MQSADQTLKNVDQNITKNLLLVNEDNFGFICQNILKVLRDIADSLSVKIFCGGEKDCTYSNICAAKKYIKRHGQYSWLYLFSDMLAITASHYTPTEDFSERLIRKYYEYLLKIRKFLKEKYKFEFLKILETFNFFGIKNTNTYYREVVDAINSTPCTDELSRERFYIEKKKPFFLDGEIFYEMTLSNARDFQSKFDHFTAFTKLDIPEYYACYLSLKERTINALNQKLPIFVITAMRVAIRPCEFSNLYEIFGKHEKIDPQTTECVRLMGHLSKYKYSLVQVVTLDYERYEYIKKSILEGAKSHKIYDLLDMCRNIILCNKTGSNILRYLLLRMNNQIIKKQFFNKRCDLLSQLNLNIGCVPFDRMPFCTSLLDHNPILSDLLECIPTENRTHEFLARIVTNNTEIEERLFTDINELPPSFNDLDTLLKEYNKRLYLPKHARRSLIKCGCYIYKQEYVEDAASIWKFLKNMSQCGIQQYTDSVDSWLADFPALIDDPDKKEKFRCMYSKSRVAIFYGPAGTGKTTFINYVSLFWKGRRKLFLTNTHTALDNLMSRVDQSNSKFSTVSSFLSKTNKDTDYDLVIMDECSTISNSDMRRILEKAKFKILLLVGDDYQIESISFGNWFGLVKKLLPKTSVFELTKPFRTKNNDLIGLWNHIRDNDSLIAESLYQNQCSSNLDESIFTRSCNDEIILCLNYDGLYGINNINKFLQCSNKNIPILVGIQTYKVGDPILFNDFKFSCDAIHNNSKGTIVKIEQNDVLTRFFIELDRSINELELDDSGYYSLVGKSKQGKSIISFNVLNSMNTDVDSEEQVFSIVPFQIAYAISIHRAQGLEYDSVKIVISDEMEEKITHNIFYTAITRAKEKLMVYWSPQTQENVLKGFKLKNYDFDIGMLKKLKFID